MKVTVPSPKYAEERLPGSDESLGSCSLPYWNGKDIIDNGSHCQCVIYAIVLAQKNAKQVRVSWEMGPGIFQYAV